MSEFKPASETKDNKINPNLALYKAFQNAFHDAARESENPIVWNTQRRMGKTTVLARLAAEYLRLGDVWFLSCNNSVETMFIDKVKAQFNDDVYIRSTKTKIEYATPDKVHVLVNPNKLHKLEDGLKVNQPVLIIVDEMQLCTIKSMDRMLPYLTDSMKTKFVATTTGISGTDTIWCAKNFGIPEVVSTGFASVDRKMKALTGDTNGWEVKD